MATDGERTRASRYGSGCGRQRVFPKPTSRPGWSAVSRRWHSANPELGLHRALLTTPAPLVEACRVNGPCCIHRNFASLDEVPRKILTDNRCTFDYRLRAVRFASKDDISAAILRFFKGKYRSARSPHRIYTQERKPSFVGSTQPPPVVFDAEEAGRHTWRKSLTAVRMHWRALASC